MSSSKLGARAPRLYQLHPLLAGPIDRWPSHLERIHAMGFDGIEVLSPFRAGRDGAIDVPADPMRLDARVAPANDDGLDALRGFVSAAETAGLAVVLEAVVPLAAADGVVAHEHGDWLARHGDGSPIQLDGAALLALDAADTAQVEAIAARLGAYLATGVRGLRLTAAHRAPAAFWREVLSRLRADVPAALFIADMLGSPTEHWRDYVDVGFTGVLDSSRWWNFHDRWFLDQQAPLAEVGTPFAFPEDPHGPRAAAELDVGDLDVLARRLEARYLAAVAIGTGLVVPMGFEFAMTRPRDPRHGSIADWEAETAAPALDLRAFIAAANALEERHPALGAPTALRSRARR